MMFATALPAIEIGVLPRTSTVAKTVANREKNGTFTTVAKTDAGDDLLRDLDRGKSTVITKIGKGWRLETNSDGRLRWRWQIKDGSGNTVTYEKADGTTGYARGSYYVGITQARDAKEIDRKRHKGRHKSGRRRASGS